MKIIYKWMFLGLFAPTVIFGGSSSLYAADDLAPVIVHTAPSTVTQPQATFSITIADDTELAYIGFGKKSALLNSITMQVVSPGVTIVTMDESLTDLSEGLNEYLVVTQDTTGNVTKEIISITYQVVIQEGSVNLSGSVSTRNFDLWRVSISNTETITVTAPVQTLVINESLEPVGCVGSSGSITFSITDLEPGASSFLVAAVGQYIGSGSYNISVSVLGPTTPSATGYYYYDDVPLMYLTYAGIPTDVSQLCAATP